MMKLTRQAEIAIDILVACARPQPNKPRTTRLVADLAGTTKDHAAQVVTKLCRHGFLEGMRGRAGGIRLSRPAEAIVIGDVLRLMEPSLVDQARTAPEPSGTALDTVVHAAIGSFVSIFDDFTIDDLAGDPSSGRLACLGCDLHSLVLKGRLFSRLRPHLRHRPRPASNLDKVATPAA
ncbi:RrF2 family transcriptional regulator [Hoeflea olei]|uniref:Rrf2 family transcriptional regulator n=1 Tax=Hoeflea olei TaxID=1480615 RepID=A0A1C1YXZ7_9HYPH|nr:Rrf2 family transcriptional regulator [Hoeflea olei]OCW58368.1 hypothetical protein AWJ14_13635 [Hoeflea olei]